MTHDDNCEMRQGHKICACPQRSKAKEDVTRPSSAATCSGTEALVCHDIAKRQRVGMNKYGMTVADNPLDLRQWLQHAYEECLDQSVYLKRAIAELDSQNACQQQPADPNLNCSQMSQNDNNPNSPQMAGCAACTGSGGWQDITTAPKDGTQILIRIHHRNRQYCEEWDRTAWEANARAYWTNHNGGGWVWSGMSGTPVMWMPLQNARAVSPGAIESPLK